MGLKQPNSLAKRTNLRRELISIVVLIILLVTPKVLASVEALESTPSEATSQVVVEGFTALNDLRSKLQWGGVVLEEEVKKGSSSVSFVVNALNIRSPLNLSVEPDGLCMELMPTALGYSIKKLSLGSNIRIEKALKVTIKETLTLVNLTAYIKPQKAIGEVSVDGRDTPYYIADVENATLVTLPSPLIIDLGRTLNISVEGEDFRVNITVRKGLGERAIDVTAEAVGNVSEVSVRASSAMAVVLQEINIPLQEMIVNEVLKDYGPLHILFSKESVRALSVGEKGSPMQLEQKSESLTPHLLIITRYRWAVLLIALIALCMAIIVGARLLAALALVLFITYFVLTWLGGTI
jgi:hypothetical protein